jgi:hypothetical protein
MKILTTLFLTLAISSVSLGQGAGSELQQFIRTTSNVVALKHARVIDGTGAAPMEDQTIIMHRSSLRSGRGYAAAQCGKALPFRLSHFLNLCDLRLSLRSQ